MPPPFRSILRLALAFFGVLLLCAGVYLGLGWAVRSRPDWLLRVLSVRRVDALDLSYRRAASALLDRDSDGDGFCDGLEWYSGSDPKDPRSHLYLYLEWTRGASVVLFRGGNAVPMMGQEGYLVVNRRQRVTGMMHLAVPGAVLLPGQKLRVQTAPGILLGPPGEPMLGEDLVIGMAPDGAVSFDVMLTDQTGGEASEFPRVVQLFNASTGEPFGGIGFQALWPEPPLAIRVEQMTAREATSELQKVDDGVDPQARVWRIHWPELPLDQQVLIDVGPAGDESQRWPICFQVGSERTCDLVAYRLDVFDQSAPVPESPVFRVTPVRFEPP